MVFSRVFVHQLPCTVQCIHTSADADDGDADHVITSKVGRGHPSRTVDQWFSYG
jgi:hypothetical protein